MNRKNIKIMAHPGGWTGQTYDIPVDSTKKSDIIKAVCDMFEYEASDFEYNKKRSEVVLKNNCYSKLRRIKVTSEHQGVDCFLILNGVVWAHSKQHNELICIDLPFIFADELLKPMETLHFSRPDHSPHMIADDAYDYIVFKCPNNEPKLLVYRKDQHFKQPIEVDVRGYSHHGIPQLTIGFSETKHILSVEFYYPNMFNKPNRFRGQINLQSDKPILQHLSTAHQ